MHLFSRRRIVWFLLPLFAVAGRAAEASQTDYEGRVTAITELLQVPKPDLDRFDRESHVLVRDFPTRPNGYQFLMQLAEIRYRYFNEPAKARAVAEEFATPTTPAEFKLWSNGFLHRLDSLGQPIKLAFTAIDGRKIDLAAMRGKVVLVDFWATWCGPCVEELPALTQIYSRHHAAGLEVVGISCDSDLPRLKDFVAKRSMPWPQYFDGHDQTSNKIAQAFGIVGIPHLFVIDKAGRLRFDNLSTTAPDFEKKIKSLLEE